MSETLDRILRCEKLEKENKALKQSRDELLSALIVAVEAEANEGYVFDDTIQRAQALKEKEGK